MHSRTLFLEALALRDAEAVLFVDDAQRQGVEDDVVLEEGVGADGDGRRAAGQGAQLFCAQGALVTAGEQDGLDALRGEGRGEGLVVLAGEDFGRRHQGRLQSGRRGVGHGQHGDHGLAGADIALQQPAHALAALQVASDFLHRAHLGAGQAEGQGGLDLVRQGAGGDDGGELGLAALLALGHRQLVGEEFVVGQPPAHGRQWRQIGLAGGRMQRLHGLAPGRKLLARQPGGILPFVELGRALQRREGQLAHDARGQAGGGWIDRFVVRDVADPLGRDVVFRVAHLQLAAEPFDLAADRALGPERIGLQQVLAAAFEPSQGQKARAVEGADTIGLGAAAGDVLVDIDDEGLDQALQRALDRGEAAIDQALGRQEQHVAHMRARQLFHQRRDLWSHALQRR